jgi:dTDP-4-dehydrorhamnose 3,5-epimerase
MSGQMEFRKTEINGVWLTQSKIHKDERGTFQECSKFMASLNQTSERFEVAQTNTSKSKKGAVRGLHFSLEPAGQWKWISCLSGSILDVVVDIRLNSPTFSRNIQVELDGENGMGVLIQANLAHGFQSTESDSIVVYNLSSEYNPDLEYAINPLDADLNIDWPISQMIISNKDTNAPSLTQLRQLGKLPI